MSEISGNIFCEHCCFFSLIVGLRSAVSEISILFLFYVFEFIDMLAFGAYRFHFLAALWVVDMAIQAGLLLLFFLKCALLSQDVAACCVRMRGRWSC